MNHRRKRMTALASSTLIAASLGIPLASPASAEPKIDEVKKQVTALYKEAEQASERYNQARDQLAASKVRLRGLVGDVEKQRKVVGSMRGDVASVLVSQYQGQSLSSASEVVFSRNSKSFVSNLNAISSFNNQRGQLVGEYAVEFKRLQLRKAAADRQVTSLSKTREKLRTEKQTIDAKAAKAKSVLNTLEEKQRKALMSGGPAMDVGAVGAKGRAGKAVAYAMAQRGDAYAWGATGPNSFDCSGLMMAAWGQAGVSLPHSSSAQMGAGRRVSESDLQAGDLVFYYSPVHHVGMYIGNGMIVHAANPGAGVRVDGLHSMPYTGAARPG